MKKIALAALLCILLLPVCGQAYEEAVVVSDLMLWTQQYLGSPGGSIYVPFELTNTSDTTLEITRCEVAVPDITGEILLREDVLSFYPKILKPGQKAYGLYERKVWGLDAARYAAPLFTLITRTTDRNAFVLPMAFEGNEVDACCGVIRACFMAMNRTRQHLNDGIGVAAFFDKGGQLLDVVIQPYADNLFPYDPINLYDFESKDALILRLWSLNYAVFDRVLERGVRWTTGFICSAEADMEYYGNAFDRDDW